MRIPQTQPRRSMRATQPSTPPSTLHVAGSGGAPTGGRTVTGGRPRMVMGLEIHLWILVLIEVALVGGFRKFFRRFHGG